MRDRISFACFLTGFVALTVLGAEPSVPVLSEKTKFEVPDPNAVEAVDIDGSNIAVLRNFLDRTGLGLTEVDLYASSTRDWTMSQPATFVERSQVGEPPGPDVAVLGNAILRGATALSNSLLTSTVDAWEKLPSYGWSHSQWYGTHPYFGASVALGGDKALVGGDDRAGSVFLYKKSCSSNVCSWRLVDDSCPGGGTLCPAAPVPGFGRVLKMSANGLWAVVGNSADANQVVFLFEIRTDGTFPYTVLRMPLLDSAPSFGKWVAIDEEGNTVLVGAAGKAYLFERPGTGSNGSSTEWKSTTLRPPYRPWDQSGFGQSVAISGGIATVGSPCTPTASCLIGTVFSYVRRPSGWDVWQEIRASGGVTDQNFGLHVAADGNRVVVATAHRVYVFHLPEVVEPSPVEIPIPPPNSAGFIGESINEESLAIYNWREGGYSGSRQLMLGDSTSVRGLALSPDSKTLYVTNLDSTKLFALSSTTLQPVKSIDMAVPGQGIALDQTGKTAFVVSNSRITVVKGLDSPAPGVVGRGAGATSVQVLPDSHGIACPPSCDQTPIAVLDTGPDSLGFIDAFTAFATVSVAHSHAIAVRPNDPDRTVYTATADGSQIKTVKLRELYPSPSFTVGSIPIPLTNVGGQMKSACLSPTAMAFSQGGNRLYLGCSSQGFAVLNANDGSLIAAGTFPGALFIEVARVKVTPDDKFVWFLGFPDDAVEVVSAQDFSVTATVPAPSHPSEIVFGGPRSYVADSALSSPTVKSGLEKPGCFPGQIFRVTATWRNNSTQSLTNVYGEVQTLTGGNTLIDQSWDLGASSVVHPGGTMTGVFRIRLAVCANFVFRINVLASTP